jgi:hypothetical protein
VGYMRDSLSSLCGLRQHSVVGKKKTSYYALYPTKDKKNNEQLLLRFGFPKFTCAVFTSVLISKTTANQSMYSYYRTIG